MALRDEFADQAMQARVLQAQAVLLHHALRDFQARTGAVADTLMLPLAEVEAVARKLRMTAEMLAGAAALGRETV